MAAINHFPRRRFLVWGGGAAASGVAAYLGLSGSGEPDAARPDSSAKRGTIKEAASLEQPSTPSSAQSASTAGQFQREAFVDHLNSEFQIELPGVANSACKLVEVSPATEMSTPRGTFTSFTLAFAAHSGFPSEGGICRVRHPGMGTMELFLSPVGRAKADKILLQAAFTLRV